MGNDCCSDELQYTEDNPFCPVCMWWEWQEYEIEKMESWSEEE